MPRVLIAADESDASLHAAQVAHRLFGDDADYFLVHVGPGVAGTELAWGVPYALVMPMDVYPPPVLATDPERSRYEAAQQAAEIAQEAQLDARPVGVVGDPADAILEAARSRDVDLIVVGSHDRNWFSRLLRPSVSHDLVREATIPVLVVK